jgi:hypothetical protein
MSEIFYTSPLLFSWSNVLQVYKLQVLTGSFFFNHKFCGVLDQKILGEFWNFPKIENSTNFF